MTAAPLSIVAMRISWDEAKATGAYFCKLQGALCC